MIDLFKYVKTDPSGVKGIIPICCSCNVRITTGSFEFWQAKRSGEITFNLYCENCTKGRELGIQHGYIQDHETGSYRHYPVDND